MEVTKILCIDFPASLFLHGVSQMFLNFRKLIPYSFRKHNKVMLYLWLDTNQLDAEQQ